LGRTNKSKKCLKHFHPGWNPSHHSSYINIPPPIETAIIKSLTRNQASNIQCTEKGRSGERKRRPYLVLDPIDAIEDDGTVPTLDVVQAIHSGVHGGTANQCDFRQRAGTCRRDRNPAAALDVHLRLAARDLRDGAGGGVGEEDPLGGAARRLGFGVFVENAKWFWGRWLINAVELRWTVCVVERSVGFLFFPASLEKKGWYCSYGLKLFRSIFVKTGEKWSAPVEIKNSKKTRVYFKVFLSK
jgi:hypothetical protein